MCGELIAEGLPVGEGIPTKDDLFAGLHCQQGEWVGGCEVGEEIGGPGWWVRGGRASAPRTMDGWVGCVVSGGGYVRMWVGGCEWVGGWSGVGCGLWVGGVGWGRGDCTVDGAQQSCFPDPSTARTPSGAAVGRREGNRHPPAHQPSHTKKRKIHTHADEAVSWQQRSAGIQSLYSSWLFESVFARGLFLTPPHPTPPLPPPSRVQLSIYPGNRYEVESRYTQVGLPL